MEEEESVDVIAGSPDEPTTEQPASTAPPLNLNLLRTFLAVHQTGSFTAAGRLLGLSQPAVTTQVRALEQQLGRELFERRSRGVIPSPFADELAAGATAPLKALAALSGRVGPHGDGIAPPVQLGGPAEVMCTLVLPALAPVIESGVRLGVTFGMTDELLQEIRAGRHDLVVSTHRPRGRGLIANPLSDEEFLLVAAPVWADRIGGSQRLESEGPAALDGVPLIAFAEDLPILRRYWRHVFGTRLTARAAVTVPDLRGVLAAVTAGAGVTVLPRYLCVDHLANGTLVLLHEPQDSPINTGYLVERPGSNDNPHVAIVRDRLLDVGRTW
ncbi:LysR family transcriptional regulator [Streptomyces sp. NPDC057137]|uniref:LysR family transcriptional regulator n=1 Tax=Streptomyces sp. NPDC057137 TaxID=3346030 RepID=UPI0036459532